MKGLLLSPAALAADISRYTLVGTKGVLTADPAYEYASGIKLQIIKGGKSSSKRFPKRDQFAAEIVYFSDCILQDKEPEPSGMEGLADVRIVRAIYESARTGRSIELSDFPDRQRPTMRKEIHRPSSGRPKRGTR